LGRLSPLFDISDALVANEILEEATLLLSIDEESSKSLSDVDENATLVLVLYKGASKSMLSLEES